MMKTELQKSIIRKNNLHYSFLRDILIWSHHVLLDLQSKQYRIRHGNRR